MGQQEGRNELFELVLRAKARKGGTAAGLAKALWKAPTESNCRKVRLWCAGTEAPRAEWVARLREIAGDGDTMADHLHGFVKLVGGHVTMTPAHQGGHLRKDNAFAPLDTGKRSHGYVIASDDRILFSVKLPDGTYVARELPAILASQYQEVARKLEEFLGRPAA